MPYTGELDISEEDDYEMIDLGEGISVDPRDGSIGFRLQTS